MGRSDDEFNKGIACFFRVSNFVFFLAFGAGRKKAHSLIKFISGSAHFLQLVGWGFSARAPGKKMAMILACFLLRRVILSKKLDTRFQE